MLPSRSHWDRLVARFFRSGWVIFIPYLGLYLLYAATGGPPGTTGAEPGGWTPSLKHAYWILHGFNLALGVGYLVRRRHFFRAIGPELWPRFLPWICLGFFFGIPGSYWEFPADTWTHYIRIMQWDSVPELTHGLAWEKWSYFFAHSLVNIFPNDLQFAALNLYYVGACLLLSWQYYRLARVTGLSPVFAMVFVILQAVLFGNSAFGFYRYYGISSSLFAQLGAVALARLALEILSARDRAPDAGLARMRRLDRAHILGQAATGLLLLVFIASNHRQGLGIGFLGIGGALAWRINRGNLSRWGAIVILAALCFATVSWYPQQHVVAQTGFSSEWFNAWHGFNVLGPGTIAADRALMIVGAFGIVNLGTALILLPSNHPAAWLTLIPVAALLLPFPAIPLADLLLRHNEDPFSLATFHRLLLAIPPGLTFVALLAKSGPLLAPGKARWLRTDWQPVLPWAGLLGALTALVVVSPQAPAFNRFYHAICQPPSDLSLTTTIERIGRISARLPRRPEMGTLALGQLAYAKGSFSRAAPGEGLRLISYGLPANFVVDDPLTFPRYRPHSFVSAPDGRVLVAPWSTMGYLSGHWLPQRGSFAFRGAPEFARNASDLGYSSIAPDLSLYQFTTVSP